MTINPSTLSAGQVGKPYRVLITTNHGPPPHQASIASGALPVGLTLGAAGLLAAAKIEEAGTFDFMVQFHDGNNEAAVQEYTLIVEEAVAAPIDEGPGDRIILTGAEIDGMGREELMVALTARGISFPQDGDDEGLRALLAGTPDGGTGSVESELNATEGQTVDAAAPAAAQESRTRGKPVQADT